MILDRVRDVAMNMAHSFLHAAVWRVAMTLPMKIVLILAAAAFVVVVLFGG